ncbi:cysteate synthase [uncultured Methanospirillum sp.]|uniref:cysteate synthase n=1 Tax=uncultured Methanospirillum sp. TaxID=262503 RepID=UPI0029C95372|nr:cysteate synthase [uncultured Methanospirillum sp.]
MTSRYQLFCPVCGTRFPDTYQLTCPSGCSGLIRAEYTTSQLVIRDLPGLFRFADWLPVDGNLPTRSGPVCYKSSGLARELGLTDLWIAFAGYWPEHNAYVTSGSFKEFEALPTMVRLAERAEGVILVASAGNTGRAFAEVSAKTGKPVIVVVPAKARDRIWTSTPADDLLLITVDGDYTDAINLGNMICTLPGVYPEGGAKNVARRDGMGTMMLEGTVTMDHLPDWYVQAVGSGTGGIAAWEASMRLVEDGRFGSHLPRLLLIQNEPFIPMANAYQAGRREIIADDMKDPKDAISQVYADVLTNRIPPYGISGGVFDALTATDGLMATATTEEAKAAGGHFKDLEGIDLDPAAAVCVAGLIRAVQSGLMRKDENILLAITGGGYERIHSEMKTYVHIPDLEVTQNTESKKVIQFVKEWVNRYV